MVLIVGDNKGKISKKLKIAMGKGIEVIGEQDFCNYFFEDIDFVGIIDLDTYLKDNGCCKKNFYI